VRPSEKCALQEMKPYFELATASVCLCPSTTYDRPRSNPLREQILKTARSGRRQEEGDSQRDHHNLIFLQEVVVRKRKGVDDSRTQRKRERWRMKAQRNIRKVN